MAHATHTELGTVVSLWRYPVKSTLGEEAHTARVRDQASAEYFPVPRIEPGKMQVKAPHPAFPDLHRGEMAVMSHRSSTQLLHGGVPAIDLDMCHGAARHPLILAYGRRPVTPRCLEPRPGGWLRWSPRACPVAGGP